MNTIKVIDYITNNPVLFTSVILLVHSLQRKFYRNIFTAWMFDVIGVFFHEVAHFIVGVVFGARPFAFSIIPQKTPNGYMMGHVKFANIKWYNAVPTALAPILLIVLAFFIDQYYFIWIDKTILSYIGYLFLLIITITSAMPSSQDFRVARSSFFGILFYITIIYVGVYFIFIKG